MPKKASNIARAAMRTRETSNERGSPGLMLKCQMHRESSITQNPTGPAWCKTDHVGLPYIAVRMADARVVKTMGLDWISPCPSDVFARLSKLEVR